jgi:hypothetical protein
MAEPITAAPVETAQPVQPKQPATKQAQFFTTAESKPVTLDSGEQANAAYLAGAIAPVAGTDVAVKFADDGKTHLVAAEDLGNAIDQGGTIATSAEYKQQQLENRLGAAGTVGAILNHYKTVAQGLASGLTAGLSEPAQVELARLLGGNEKAAQMRQKLKDMKEYSPLTWAGGEVSGVLSGAIASAGLGSLGAAGRGAAALVNPIGELGGLAAEGVGTAIGPTTSVAGRLGAATLKGAAQGAVEGGLYNATHEVSEQLLDNNPQLSAEKIAAAGGKGAFWGMLLGAGAGLATHGVQELAAHAAPALQEAANHHSFKALNPTASQVRKIEALPGGIEGVGKRAFDEGITSSPFVSHEEMLKTAATKLDDSIAKLDSIRLQADAAGIKGPTPAKVTARIDADVIAPLEKFGDYHTPSIETANKIKAMITHVEPKDLMAWREIRQLVDEGAKFDTTVSNPTRDIFKQVRNILVDEEGTALEGQVSAFGKSLGAELKDENLRFRQLLNINKVLENAAARDATKSAIGLSDAILTAGGLAAGHGVAGLALGAANHLVKAGGSTTAAFAADKLAKLAKLADLSQETGSALEKITASLAAKRDGSLHNKNLEIDKFDSIVSNIHSLNENPQLIQQHMEQRTAGYAEHAPQIQQGLSGVAARGVTYLAQNAPKAPKAYPTGNTKPNDFIPDSEKAAFLRKAQAVMDPITVFKHISAGTATPEEMEALRIVYPELVVATGGPIMQTLAKATHKAPRSKKVHTSQGYQTVVQIGVASGSILDPTLEPDFIRTMQVSANYIVGGQEQEKRGPGRPPNPKPLGGFADAASTDYNGVKGK